MRAILRSMRALVFLGVLTTAACGLEMGGLGADPFGADSTSDAASMDEGAATLQDGSAGGDAILTTFSVADAGGAAQEASLQEDTGSDAFLASPGDGGVGAGDAGEEGAAAQPTQGDASGILPEGGGGKPAPDAVAPSDGAAPCTLTIPAGWKLSLYTPGPDPCPFGFTAHDVFAEPVVGAAGCTCACTVTQDGDCLQGTMTVSGNPDNGLSCDMQLFSMDVNGTSCLTVPPNSPPVSLPPRTQATALPAQGAACSGTSQVDPTQVSTAAARYCDVPAASADSVCNGATPGFMACIATSGVVDCPQGSAFSHRSVVEDSATLQCSPCTACTVATTCSNATISAYDNRSCHDPPVALLQVDGACDLTMATGGGGGFMGMGGGGSMGMGGGGSMGMGGGGSMGMGGGGNPMGGEQSISALSVQYNVTAATACTAGSSTATAQLMNPETICCE